MATSDLFPPLEFQFLALDSSFFGLFSNLNIVFGFPFTLLWNLTQKSLLFNISPSSNFEVEIFMAP